MFYEHVDTRISSLSYIKVKRFDNDIKTRTTSKIYTNYVLKENQIKKKKKKEKKTMQHRGIELT